MCDDLYVICWRGPSGIVYHGEPFAAHPGGYEAARELADAMNGAEPGMGYWVQAWRG